MVKLPAPFLYLFTMDLCRIPFQTFEEYDEDEPGFALSMLQAYIAAFRTQSHGTMSHGLIKTIHQTAMTHLKNASADDYREDWGSFAVSLSAKGKYTIPNYSATPDGVGQFISEWIANPKTATHYICLNNENMDSLIVYGVGSKQGSPIFCRNILGVLEQFRFNAEKHLPVLIEAMKDGFCTEITTLENIEQHDLQATTHKMMQTIIDDYNDEITQSKNDEARIRVVCKYVQKINQLHPFMDGNIRTCYILLNKLLHDLNLPLSLLMNPNRLDCCSTDEIVSMVKEGQAIYKSLLAHQQTTPFIINSNEEKHLKLKSFSCPAVDLKNESICDDFVQFVLNAKAPEIKAIPLQKPVVIHSNTNPYALNLLREIEKMTTAKPILQAINEGKYGLALRLACGANNPCLVKAIIHYKNELSIDVNQPSTNGNTSLDWFDLKTTDSTEKYEVRQSLLDCGALNNKVLENQSPVVLAERNNNCSQKS